MYFVINNLQLFSLIQHRFILIQFVTFTCVLFFYSFVRFFVLVYLTMAKVQAETCNTHVNVTN